MFASTQLACLKIHTRTIIPRTLMSSIYHIIFIAGCRIYHRIITGIFFFVSLRYYKLLFHCRLPPQSNLPVLQSHIVRSIMIRNFIHRAFRLFICFCLFCHAHCTFEILPKIQKRFLFLHNIKYTNYQEITIITGTFPLPTHELHLSFQARKESYSFSAREYPLQLLMY